LKVGVNSIPASVAARVNTSFLKDRIGNLRSRISGSRQTIRSVLALLSSSVVSSVLTAAGGLLVARFIGPEVNGSFRAYTIPLTYLIFLHLGTWDGLWRQIPYYVGKEMPEKVDAIASAAGAFNLLISIVVSCGFVFCAAYSLAHHDFYGFAGWLSQVLCCWGVFYGGYLTSTYRTLHHFVTLSRIQVYQTLLNFGMVFSLPFLGFYGLCARVGFPSFLSVWLYHRSRPLKVNYRFDTKAFRELIRIGLPFSFWGNLYTSVWTATESTLVFSFAGVSDLGLFSVAIVMAGAVNSLPMAIWQVLTPRVVTNLAREGSVRNANARIVWVTAGLTGFMILIACAGSFLLNIFVPLFIPKYVAGIPVMKVCLWFPVVQAAFLPMNTLFATGRPWLYGRSVIPGIIVFVIATYLLLPVVGGLLAVAAGSLLGRAARTIAGYLDLVALTRREGLNCRM
jgi:O-antigen/teichoic acid export membrane protein